MASKNNIQDDFFGDCDDYDADHRRMDDDAHQIIDEYGELTKRETVAIERQYFAIGYHETYDECYEASLQSGFDDGYRHNYDTALRLGHLLGQFAVTVATANKSDSELQYQANRGTKSARQTLTEGKLIEVSQRVRSQLLSISHAAAPRGKKYSNDERLQNSYDGITEDVVLTSTNLVQQRLQEQRDLEHLAEDIKNLVSINVTKCS
jgi:hypothetical protein